MNTKTETAKWKRVLLAAACSMVFATTSSHAEDDYDGGFFSDWEIEAEAGYVSRFVEEGLEEFKNGAYTGEVELEKYFDVLGGLDVFLGGEVAGAVTANFTEVELFAGVGSVLFDDLYGTIAYYYFHESPVEVDEGEEGTGKELEAALEYSGFEWVNVDAGWLQSLDNGGSMYSIGIGTEFEFLGAEVTPHIGAFYDAGYVSKEHDDWNNIEYSITAEWELWENMELAMNITYSKAQRNLYLLEEEEEGDDDGDEEGEAEEEEESVNDLVWVGFNLGYEF